MHSTGQPVSQSGVGYVVQFCSISHWHLVFYTLKVVTDLFTTTFFAYFLRFLASKYALRITVAKLRTEGNPDFLSIFIHFGSFQGVFSLLKGGNFFTDP